MSAKESVIRTAIAKNLHLLDEKLKLVKEEHYISMPDGNRAFIDILAKDKFGCFTVIELKKSNQTARSAVQQLYKYAHFLKKKNRLEENQIRCFILSTVWDELEAPFSEFSHFSSYESKGYKVEYNKSKPPKFIQKDFIYETGNSKPLENFIFFEFPTMELRDKLKLQFEQILDVLPSLNSVLITTDYNGTDEAIINPHGFAWIVYTGNISDIQGQLSMLKTVTVSEDLYDARIYAMWETSQPESLLRTEILTKYVKLKKDEGQPTEHKLHTLNNTLSLWKYSPPVGYGVMFNDGLFDEDELIAMSCGFVGQHPYNFVVKTTPSRTKQFNMVRERVDTFLSANKRWKQQVKHLLSTMECDDVADIRIFNPLNIFGLMNDIFTVKESKRIPSLIISIKKTNGSTEVYYGSLFWRKNLELLKPEIAIKQAYPSLKLFAMRAVAHNFNQYDESLSELYGLSYEIICEKNKKMYLLEVEDNYCTWEQYDTLENLQNFIDSKGSLIDEVGAFFERQNINYF